MYKVGIVGYGTIGKRVADAVIKQKDMKLIGVTAHHHNYKIEIAQQKGIDIYAVGDITELCENGIKVKGSIKNLLEQIDVVVDCTPKKVAMRNKEEMYDKYPILKAIYQGGEKADIGQSFVAQCNYRHAIGKKNIRVVSCNTTGLARTIHAINQKWPIKRVRATLIRRATDPGEINRGPVNAIVPCLELPSHHGPDVRTVLPEVEVFTTAVVVPTTLMHMHNLSVNLREHKPSREEVMEVLRNTRRIRIVNKASGVNSTAEIMEYAKDLGHLRGDMTDICIWEKGVGVHGNEIFFMQAIHQESDVIPENIDAIRASMGFEDAEESMRMTDASLRINNGLE
ncbi:MAG: type II glyceraldehyde-3-phosphate dehydrogenase [Candidatus Woesearchaeota archaeon]